MAGFMRRRIDNFFQSCTVGTQSIAHDNPRVSVVSYCFLQEPERRFFIASLRRVNLNNFAFMINGTPQIMLNTVDFYENLVQMPPPMCSVTSLDNTLFSDFRGKHRAKSLPPKPYCLMANIDTALSQYILNLPQREGIADIQHYCRPDYLGG